MKMSHNNSIDLDKLKYDLDKLNSKKCGQVSCNYTIINQNAVDSPGTALARQVIKNEDGTQEEITLHYSCDDSKLKCEDKDTLKNDSQKTPESYAINIPRGIIGQIKFFQFLYL